MTARRCQSVPSGCKSKSLNHVARQIIHCTGACEGRCCGVLPAAGARHSGHTEEGGSGHQGSMVRLHASATTTITGGESRTLHHARHATSPSSMRACQAPTYILGAEQNGEEQNGSESTDWDHTSAPACRRGPGAASHTNGRSPERDHCQTMSTVHRCVCCT